MQGYLGTGFRRIPDVCFVLASLFSAIALVEQPRGVLDGRSRNVESGLGRDPRAILCSGEAHTSHNSRIPPCAHIRRPFRERASERAGPPPRACRRRQRDDVARAHGALTTQMKLVLEPIHVIRLRSILRRVLGSARALSRESNKLCSLRSACISVVR